MSGLKVVRIALVTAVLLFASAFVGGLLGAAMIGVFAVAVGEWNGFLGGWGTMMLSGYFGLIIGAIVGPVVAWAALRDVPLWRVFAHASVGTVIGGWSAFVASGLDPLLAMGGAVVGLVVAALRLRMANQRTMHGRPDRRGFHRIAGERSAA